MASLFAVCLRGAEVCCDVETGHEVQKYVVMLKQVMRCRGMLMVNQVAMLKQVMRCRGMVCCGVPCRVFVGDTQMLL